MAKATKAPKETASKEELKRTSFVLKSTVIKKLNYIKVMDGTEITDMVDLALNKHISDWEKKNGTIPVK